MGFTPHHQVGTTAWPTSLGGGGTGRVRWGLSHSGPIWATPSCWWPRASVQQPREGQVSTGPASPLTEASPSSQRLPAYDQGLWLTMHSHPHPNRQFCLSGYLGTSWKQCLWSNSPPWVVGATHRISSGRLQTLHPGKGTLWKPHPQPQILTLSTCPPA